MPRIYNSLSEPLDFCKRDFPKSETLAFFRYGVLGDGPDGRRNCFEYNAQHPDYDADQFDCQSCGLPLCGRDN